MIGLIALALEYIAGVSGTQEGGGTQVKVMAFSPIDQGLVSASTSSPLPVISSTQEATIQAQINENTSMGDLQANDTIIANLVNQAAQLPPNQPLLPIGTGIGAQVTPVSMTPSEYLASAEQIQAEGGYLSPYDISILQAAGQYKQTLG